MKRNTVVITLSMLFVISLLCSQVALADTDTPAAPGTVSPSTTVSPDAGRVFNPDNTPRTTTKPKPTTTEAPATTLKPTTTAVPRTGGGTDEVYSPGQEPKQSTVVKRSATTTTSSTTTTVARKKKHTIAAPAGIKSTTTSEPENGRVVVAGERVENPVAKRKPFELGFDIKPYLGIAVLLMLSVTTGYSRTARPRAGKGHVIKKGTAL